jgi:polyhydroxyalkanoate synthesis regulator phasin
MDNPIRTGIYAGLGLALRTRDAVMETGRRIVQESSMSEDEGRRFVDDLLRQSEDLRGRLSELVEERVSDVLSRFDLARRSDIERLEQHITELETKNPDPVTARRFTCTSPVQRSSTTIGFRPNTPVTART